MSESTGYVVALRYTAKAGGYAGVVTWTKYASKAEFDQSFSRDDMEVVEEGITEERAEQLADQTTDKCMLMAAIEQSCNKETGEVIPTLLQHNLEQTLFLISTKKFHKAA